MENSYKSMIKISVITISYNAKSCIEKTIQSVINQDYDNYEYIIVDGNSKDGTFDILKKYDSSINNWISEPDSGIYNAMNKAVQMSKGNYCIFMNAGDTFFNKKVLSKVDAYLDSNYDVLVGNEISIKNDKIVDYVISPSQLTFNKLFNSSLCHQASFIKRELLIQYPYDEQLRLVSDWKFWIQSIILGGASYMSIEVDVCCFNREGATYSQKQLGVEERNRVFKELIPNRIFCDYESFNKRNQINLFIFRVKRSILHKLKMFRNKHRLNSERSF